jgi:predicted enzyme related to lactoylglutathione lyase
MAAPCYFEIHVDDMARAKQFYGDVFGWTYRKNDFADIDYWFIETGEPNAMRGGMLPRFAPLTPMQPPSAFVVTLMVPDFEATLQKALAAGGIIAMPKFAIPGMGWQGYLIDSEKNVLGMFQPDANAR